APVSSQDGNKIGSAFKMEGNNEIEFQLGAVSNSSELVIDPWTTTPTTGGFAPIDVEIDAANNTYILGGTPSSFSMSMSEQQYSPGGALVWTYNFTQYPATTYMSDLAIDQKGNSYVA